MFPMPKCRDAWAKANVRRNKMAEELIGKPVKKEGVEDFLWAMTMLPEFQLIY